MKPRPIPLFAAGAAAVAALALGAHFAGGPRLIAGLERQAQAALAGTGVAARFRTSGGWLSRHPRLSGGAELDPAQRRLAVTRIAVLPGVGGISWSGPRRAAAAEHGAPPGVHCQQQVEAILEARTIRFAEASAALDPASDAVLGEVAAALRPCAGSVIAVIGHTDAGGDPRTNLALSLERARAVREALVARGIARNALRARGEGASTPREGLAPADPANRRIDFRVIFAAPLAPTPVDTPGAG
ncbi:MAG: OmpA family protein [Novosphingobium sp.]